jgi:hypothetical protein
VGESAGSAWRLADDDIKWTFLGIFFSIEFRLLPASCFVSLRGIQTRMSRPVDPEMKSIYRAIFVLCAFILALGCVIDFAILPDEWFASALAKHPDGWQIHLEKPEPAWHGRDDQGAKELVLTFLQKNEHPTYNKLGDAGIALVIVGVFSALGFVRERYLEKKQAGGRLN